MNQRPAMVFVGTVVVLSVLPVACGSAPTNPTHEEGSCQLATGIPGERTPPSTDRRALTSKGELLIADPNTSEAPRSYTGTWLGDYRVSGCSRTCGLGHNVCDNYLAGGGQHFSVRLRLTQDVASVSGTLDLFDNTGRVIVESGPVTGAVDASNTLVLSGTTYTTDPTEPSQTLISGWSSALAADGNGLTGRFTQNRTFKNFYGTQQLKIDCELVNVHRQDS